MAQATFNGNGNYKIDVDAALVSQSGLTSTIYWRVLVIKTNNFGHRAWGNSGSSGWADGNPGRIWNAPSIEYNFQNGSQNGTFTMAEGTFAVNHRADGHAEYYVSAGLTLVNLGSASAGTGWRSLPRIQTATVPSAPTPGGFGVRTMTSIQYRFIGNSDGGAPIREYQALYQNATLNGPQIEYWSNGFTDLGGLIPGHTYNFWSRGRNDIGWGPWSAISSARTVAPAFVRHGGVWREAIPYVKVNGAWRAAQPFAKVNGIWRKAE